MSSSETMGARMQPDSCLLDHINGKFYGFKAILSHIYSSDCGLRNISDEFVCGNSGNPLLASFRSTLCKDSVPGPRRSSLRDELVTGVLVSSIFMGTMEHTVRMTASAPFERVKLLLQNQGELIRSGRLSRPYLGINDCFSRTIRNEGVLSLWRGNSVCLIGFLSEKVLLTAFRGFFNAIAIKLRKDEQQELYLEKWLTGVATMGCACLCSYPLKYAHIRLATDIKCCKGSGERQFSSLFDLYRKTFKSDGIVGIYRGMGLYLLAEQFFQLSRFAGNSKPSKENWSTKTSILVAVYIAVYPMETVQYRMMMTSGEVSKYKSYMHALFQIIKNEGIRSLYKGFGASYLSGIPSMFVMLWFSKLKKDSRTGGTISVVIDTD